MSGDKKYSICVTDLVLTNGYTLKRCFIDPVENAPPGFIAIRAGVIEEGKPVTIKLVKVANIAYLEVEESEAAKLWQGFNPLPETVIAKQ